MKVVVPMAGRGSRFSERGISTPKPLIPVGGNHPMVWWALHSLADVSYSHIIFIALQEHDDQYAIADQLRAIMQSRGNTAQIDVLLLPDVTAGQLCTVLEARQWIDTDEDVLVANCDTYIVSDLGAHIAGKPADCHGIISTVNAPGDRWSFARTDTSGRVVEVAEKVRISDHASTGYYYFSNGRELCALGDAMIAAGETTRGEYYVIPVYQKMIARGWRVDISPVREMWDMGTPDSLAAFETHLNQR